MRKVIYRPYQQAKADDFNNTGEHNREYDEELMLGGMIDPSQKYYRGLTVTQNGPTEVAIADGQFWDANKIYVRDTSDLIGGVQARSVSVYNFLPIAKSICVAVVVFGQESDGSTEPRDFLIEVSSLTTEPEAVATVRSRLAVVEMYPGLEADNPLPPTIPVNTLHIANIYLDPSAITRVEMLATNLIPSTSRNHQRIGLLENQYQRYSATLDWLFSWTAELEDKFAEWEGTFDHQLLSMDVSRVQARLDVRPFTDPVYASDPFANKDNTDEGFTGYDARVLAGLLFPTEASDSQDLVLLSSGDTTVRRYDSGLVLPAFSEVTHYDTGVVHWSGGEFQASYQNQTVEIGTLKTSEWVHAQGWSYNQYVTWWEQTSRWDVGELKPEPPHHFDRSINYWGWREKIYSNEWTSAWLQNWTMKDVNQVYVDNTSTTAITGAFISQTFVAPKAFWLTAINLYFTELAASGDVTVMVCDTVAGRPDLNGAYTTVTIPYGDLQTYAGSTGSETRFELDTPIFLEMGKRYAVIIASGGAHRFAAIDGNLQTEGDLLFGTDGNYFVLDASKDLLMTLSGALFERSQLSVSLGAASLSGGVEDLRITAPAYVPQNATFMYEMQDGGAWYPMNQENAVLDGELELLPLRVTMAGTSTAMPGFYETTGAIEVGRSKTTINHVSTLQAVGRNTTDISVYVYTHRFDDSIHDLGCSIIEADGDERSAAATEVRETAPGVHRHRFQFLPPANIDEFRVKIFGNRSGENVSPFTISERSWVVGA